MANYSYTNSGIQFSLPSFDNTKMAKFTKKYVYANDYQYAQEDGIQPFVNAVEIDWNNAQLGAGLIRPIGELRCSRVVPMGYRRFAII